MWTERLLRRNRPPRLAPPRVPHLSLSRDGGPPDGWEPLDPTPGDRVLAHVDRALLRFVNGAAAGITRREFLRRAGEAGLVIGLSASVVLWERPAGAEHTFENCKGCPPCGPSEHCGNSKCKQGDCDLSVSYVRKRPYGGSNCAPSDAHNCWKENCCDKCGPGKTFHCIARCCDCCTTTVTASGICNCASPTRYLCHCRNCRASC